jgi:hypothetical protein
MERTIGKSGKNGENTKEIIARLRTNKLRRRGILIQKSLKVAFVATIIIFSILVVNWINGGTLYSIFATQSDFQQSANSMSIYIQGELQHGNKDINAICKNADKLSDLGLHARYDIVDAEIYIVKDAEPKPIIYNSVRLNDYK